MILVESKASSLEAFKRQGDMALRDMFSDGLGNIRFMVGFDLKRSFLTEMIL